MDENLNQVSGRHLLNRRGFLGHMMTGISGVALAQMLARDGLLADATLQGVVDLQVQRDGAALAAMLTHERADVRARAALALASVQAGDALLEVFYRDGSGLAAAEARLARPSPIAGQPLLDVLPDHEVYDLVQSALAGEASAPKLVRREGQLFRAISYGDHYLPRL